MPPSLALSRAKGFCPNKCEVLFFKGKFEHGCYIWKFPIFIFLISKRIKEMRDMARESNLAVKELNANIKYLKRKGNEA